MRKLVKLSLDCQDEQLHKGYQVELVEIREDCQDGRTLKEGVSGRLSPVLNIHQLYKEWSEKYKQLEYLAFRGITTLKICQLYRESQEKSRPLKDLAFRGLVFCDTDKAPESVSIEDCQDLAQQLRDDFNAWLDERGFRKIDETIRTYLDPSDEIRILIKTQDYRLWELPWSVWDFFESYPQSEIVFSSSEAKGDEKPVDTTPRKRVKILALCGDQTGINYQTDQDNIKRLRSVGAEPEFLEEPPLQQVRNWLWDKHWEIFFFAGHSSRQEGLIINKYERMTIEQFEKTLKTAIENGLKIAFFNSCDGLNLAYKLVKEFHIPVAIAMREPVPNGVAQKFLEYFLIQYAYRKQPLHIAVRKARQRIAEEWQELLPGIDWLPVICQNSARRPPTWQELHQPISLPDVGLVSLACTTLVMVARFFLLLQPLEFAAYDHFLQKRPGKEPDPRILIVEANKSDIQGFREATVPDDILLNVLKNLQKYQPKVIGSDIMRDVPGGGSKEAWDNLLKELKASQIPIISGYSFPDRNDIRPYPPPPGVPKKRLSFINFDKDNDRVVRRHLISVESEASVSLSYQLVWHYLSKPKIKFPSDYLQFGNIKLKKLTSYTGAYTKLSGTFEFLLNYRTSKPNEPVAETIHLMDVHRGTFNPELVKDRIVLIGYTDTSKKDLVETPIDPEMPGVIFHAHMVSHLLSAVSDRQPLLWGMPWLMDAMAVFAGSFLGGVMVWRIRRLWLLGFTTIITIIIVYELYFLIFWKMAGWMPLIPSLLGIVLTISGSVVMYVLYPVFQREKNF